MKKQVFITSLLVVAILALPFVVSAASNPYKSNVFDPTILNGPLLVCTGVPTTGGTSFPTCQNLCDFVAQVANIIYFSIAVVLWIIAPILLTVGGIMLMLGGQNPHMIETAKKTITGAVIGILIVLAAWLIVFVFISAFGNLNQYIGGFGSGNSPTICTVSSS